MDNICKTLKYKYPKLLDPIHKPDVIWRRKICIATGFNESRALNKCESATYVRRNSRTILVNYEGSVLTITSADHISPFNKCLCQIVLWDFGYCGHYWSTVPAPDDRWWWLWLWRNWWNEDWQGKPKYSEKTCPSATLSTTNTIWLDSGLNPDRRGEKPATNRFSYGAANVNV
jgi:hypothetical protein